ncbi:disease resistance protein RPV1-like [Pyrus communis]|uniref:disease resistance protein RPV1-like n=1 Tax=Pyrus communis TaxID=23211 RepID=UPI0035BF51CD
MPSIVNVQGLLKPCHRKSPMGTEAVQGLTLDLQESDEASFSTEAFRNMQSLRLLKLNYVKLTGSYNNLSNELRWLCWHGFPLEVIPEDFDHPNIVAIDLSYSKLKRVWEDSELLEKLKFLNLSHSHYLTRSPDFSKLPNLEQLILRDCKCLVDIDQSIGQLEKLVLVDLKDCKALRVLPESFYKSTSIEILDLADCSKFENLAEDLGEMSSLTTLVADNTALKSLPSSILRLKNLNYLSLHGLKWPLSTYPIPPLLSGLNTLRVLSLAGCNLTDDKIPKELVNLNFLEHLDLQKTRFYSLPSLSGVSKLRTLCLNDCTKLRAIPDLPTNLEILKADECIALEKMPDFSEMSKMRVLHLNHSPKLTEIPGMHNSLNSMTRIHMEGCTNLTAEFRKKILQGWTSCGYGGIFLNGNYIPEWFRYYGGDEVCFVVPQSVGSNFEGLTLCCVYSSNKQPEDCPLVISSRNKIKRTALLAHITYASVPTFCDYEDHYLWQGQLSNDVLCWHKGDEVNIFVGPAQPGDNSPRVKKIAVDLVWDKFIKENMYDSHPGLYDLYPHQDCLSGDNYEARTSHDASDENRTSKTLRSDNFDGDDDEAGPSNDSSDENQTPKRLRPDPVGASSSSTKEGPQLSRSTHPQSRWIEIIFEAGAKNIGHAGVFAAECQTLGDGVAYILHKRSEKVEAECDAKIVM